MPKKVFPGRFAAAVDISNFVVAEAEAAGFNEKEIYAVELALDEAVANIVEHAYGAEDVGEIVCTCEVSGGVLRIELEDKGKPFDPAAVPEPKVGAPLEELGPGGAGLFLMRKMMDEVKFDFGPQKGTRLTMIKRKGE